MAKRYIHCLNQKNSTTKTPFGLVSFNHLSIAEVDDRQAEMFTRLNGYMEIMPERKTQIEREFAAAEAKKKAEKEAKEGKPVDVEARRKEEEARKRAEEEARRKDEEERQKREEEEAARAAAAAGKGYAFDPEKRRAELAAMKVDELKKIAAELGAEIPDGAKKDDIIKAIVEKQTATAK